MCESVGCGAVAWAAVSVGRTAAGIQIINNIQQVLQQKAKQEDMTHVHARPLHDAIANQAPDARALQSVQSGRTYSKNAVADLDSLMVQLQPVSHVGGRTKPLGVG